MEQSDAQKTHTNDKPMFSIIIPAFNEVGNLETVLERVTDALDPMNRPYEVIFIDDGSSDGTTELLRTFPERHPSARTIILTRNYGQHAAVAAGFDAARGEYLVAMDSDLQVDPRDLPRIVEKMDEGYDVVAGYRENRKEGFITRLLPSFFINKFFKKFLRLPYRDMGCGMQAFRRSSIEGIDPHSSLYVHRAIYALWSGRSFADIPVHYQDRQSGDSKYHLSKLVFLTLDMIIIFLKQPLQLVVFFLLGSILTASGIFTGLTLVILTLFGVAFASPLWTLALFLTLTGILFMTFGFTNERLNRINHNLNAAPCYVIRETIENNLNYDNKGNKDNENETKTKENSSGQPT